MDTERMEWQPSPSGTVWRKRLHRVGGAESGRVTSIVRYQPDASFHAHDHPEGEEIFVLRGTFSDEHGDWPAGSYLLNPEGFRHAPFSREGCLLFVKLRQYAGDGRHHVALQVDALPWQPDDLPGIEVKRLYSGPELDPAFPDESHLERWAPGAVAPGLCRAGGAEILVLEGSFEDGSGRYRAGTWLRFPVGSSHSPFSREGCELYVKTGALASLR